MKYAYTPHTPQNQYKLKVIQTWKREALKSKALVLFFPRDISDLHSVRNAVI